MQSYIAKVYTSANPDFIETITLPAGEIDGAMVCGLLADAMSPCLAQEAFVDASNGETTVERDDDLGSESPITFVIYDIPRCERDADLRESETCDAHECECDGDIYLITLDPTE